MYTYRKLLLASFILSSLVLAGCANKSAKPPVLGGDRDKHGCIGSAGYSWCEAKQKCLRPWEEKCETATSTPGASCSCPAGYYLEGETCNPDCYKSVPKCLRPSIVCTKTTGNLPQDISYVIGGKKITLKNGIAEEPVAPGSVSKTVTKIFEATAKGDANSDGREDVVVILTQSSGGSGTFYYVALAVGGKDGFTGTEAVLLGDRIAPQPSEIRQNIIIVNYADRKPGEPMTAKPSVGASRYFGLEEGKLKEIQSSIKDIIELKTPSIGEYVSSPLVISGRARGNWYFEASFPVVLVDWDGRIIAQGPAQAKSDWMTTNFVDFTAKLEFTKPTVKNNGALILKKDNPSGLPQHDKALEIPIFFK